MFYGNTFIGVFDDLETAVFPHNSVLRKPDDVGNGLAISFLAFAFHTILFYGNTVGTNPVWELERKAFPHNPVLRKPIFTIKNLKNNISFPHNPVLRKRVFLRAIHTTSTRSRALFPHNPVLRKRKEGDDAKVMEDEKFFHTILFYGNSSA